jgi:hypothetical protein
VPKSAEPYRQARVAAKCLVQVLSSAPLIEASAAMQLAESRSMGGKVVFSESQTLITSFTSIIGLLERAACKQ